MLHFGHLPQPKVGCWGLESLNDVCHRAGLQGTRQLPQGHSAPLFSSGCVLGSLLEFLARLLDRCPQWSQSQDCFRVFWLVWFLRKPFSLSVPIWEIAVLSTTSRRVRWVPTQLWLLSSWQRCTIIQFYQIHGYFLFNHWRKGKKIPKVQRCYLCWVLLFVLASPESWRKPQQNPWWRPRQGIEPDKYDTATQVLSQPEVQLQRNQLSHSHNTRKQFV